MLISGASRAVSDPEFGFGIGENTSTYVRSIHHLETDTCRAGLWLSDECDRHCWGGGLCSGTSLWEVKIGL